MCPSSFRSPSKTTTNYSLKKSKMLSMEFDKVKAEKQDAMRRYNRQKYSLFSFKLLVVSVLIYSSFSSSFPLLLHKASLYLPLHLRVFLLLNAIVLLVYYSSSSTNNTHFPPGQTSELYDEYVSHSTQKQIAVLPPLEDTVHDKQMVICEVNDTKVVVENKVRDITVVKSDEEKCFRRTKSEKYVRENMRRNVLRRSETEKAMEEMNNEEFRRTIERFIESKKKILRDENMALMTLEDVHGSVV